METRITLLTVLIYVFEVWHQIVRNAKDNLNAYRRLGSAPLRRRPIAGILWAEYVIPVAFGVSDTSGQRVKSNNCAMNVG